MPPDPPVPSSWQDSYARGILDGQVSTRLDQHDAQLAVHSALFERITELVGGLAAQQQTLIEARVTDAATRVATAEAVKDAKIVQEEQAKRSWSPATKLVTALSAVAVLWALLTSLLPGA